MKATIFIPVYNGEFDNLESTLDAACNQKTDYRYEVLITDSESSDNSVKIIEQYCNKYNFVTLKKIKKSEFSHGKTRQKAAEWAKGELIVYLTQDATPANENWLNEMIRPFDINDNIMAVLGRQKPRPNCIPMLKYEILGVFNSQGPSNGLTLYMRNPNDEKGNFTEKTYYSDVCTATRREFLLKKIGYKPVNYAEDQLFGREIIDAGYIKAYNGEAFVIHSNNIALKNYKKRMFDETYAMSKISSIVTPISFVSVITRSVKGSVRDFLRIINDNEISKKRRLYWMLINPLFQLEKWRGIRLANMAMANNLDDSKYSLERRK